MSFIYHNPVKIHYNTSLEDALELIKGELPPRILLVTSRGWLMRGINKRLKSILPKSHIHIISDISPNPELVHLQALKESLSGEQAIIAIGGGSVLDSAKFFAMQSEISARGGELHIGQGRERECVQNMSAGDLLREASSLDSSVLANIRDGVGKNFSAGLLQGEMHSDLNLSNTLKSISKAKNEKRMSSNVIMTSESSKTLESYRTNLQQASQTWDSKTKQDSIIKKDFGTKKLCENALHTSGSQEREMKKKELQGSRIQDGQERQEIKEKQEIKEIKEIKEGKEGKEPTALPLFAFPTTAGTSSELTQWATIWDSKARVKYSLSHPTLYAKTAVYDMSLFSSLPREVMLHTTLDSLSHACEAIWNKNANPISTHHALKAIELILAYLPRLFVDLGDCLAREGLVRASIHAGLAFSNTQTALAHAISYPITMESGVPHGLACSFSLPLLLECIIDEMAETMLKPYKAEISGLFKKLGVSTKSCDYDLDSAKIDVIFESLNARAKNGLLDIERAKAGLKASAR